MSPSKRLLIVYHSQSGHTAALARAALAGAARVDEVRSVLCRAGDAGPADLLACDGVLLGSPENFGYMSGAIKDFFDRSYYPCEGQLEGLPYALFISAGNDGSGAQREMTRIITGLAWRKVQEALIVRGEPTAEGLAAAAELGEGMATGLALGIF